MSESHTPLTRRTLARAGAWGVPAVTIVAPAPAYASSDVSISILLLLRHQVWQRLNGLPQLPAESAPPYSTPPGSQEMGTWDTVLETFFAPSVPANGTLSPEKLMFTLQATQSLGDSLRAFGVTHFDGTLDLHYTASGCVVSPGTRVVRMGVAMTEVPPSGPPVIRVVGEWPAETATVPGSIHRTVGAFTATLSTVPANPLATLGLAGALNPDGQNNTLATLVT